MEPFRDSLAIEIKNISFTKKKVGSSINFIYVCARLAHPTKKNNKCWAPNAHKLMSIDFLIEFIEVCRKQLMI